MRRKAEDMALKKIGTVSIIMAAYNAEKTISDAIDSILAQEYTDFELLVLDDCSVDGTKSIVDRYHDERIRYIRNPENMGPARTRLRAASMAMGEWIAILDSDDMWEADKLRQQVDLLENSDALLSYTGYSFLTEDGRKLAFTYAVPERITYSRLLHHNVIGNSTIVMRRDLFLEHAGTDSSVHEDYACWLRFLGSGFTALGINRPLVRYRISTHSKSGNKRKAARMNWNTYREIGIPIVYRVWYMISYAFFGIVKHGRIKAAIWKEAHGKNTDRDI